VEQKCAKHALIVTLHFAGYFQKEVDRNFGEANIKKKHQEKNMCVSKIKRSLCVQNINNF